MCIILLILRNFLTLMNKEEQLLALINHYAKGNKTQFASIIGITPQGLNSWISRKTFDIERIYAKCVGVSADWLLTGEGAMLNSHININPSETFVKKVDSNSKEGIPLIPLDAIAGFPATDSSYAYMENCDRYIIPEFQDKGADFIIRVSGDSMIPLYYNGDLIACHKIHDIRFFQWGTVYVLETSQGILVKRIMESTDHDDCILCTSENDTVHRPFLLPKDDIRSMSTIVGLIRIV